MTLFDSGIRPAIDNYLLEEAAKERDYGDYWSASSAGYCMRKLIFERLGVPAVTKESDGRRQRVFTSGHIFHKWVQDITKNTGLSIAQELELQDEELMVRGHIDDLVLIKTPITDTLGTSNREDLILYDYKTQNSRAFTWQKGRPVSYFHRLQVGTYMYMLRKGAVTDLKQYKALQPEDVKDLSEARILKISKDDLRMDENQVLWDAELEADVIAYWELLNSFWESKMIPPCSCDKHEGGFMANEAFNPYFYEGEPCSIKLYDQWKANKLKEVL